MHKIFNLVLVLTLLSSCLKKEIQSKKPKLVVQIIVDQLRGDIPSHFYDKLSKRGLRFFLDEGVHFENAHYNHANTETAVGHSVIATGLDPSEHGIIANDWIDPISGEFVYNTEDEDHSIIGKTKKRHKGVSPKLLKAETFGDKLVESSKGSRVFSVSGKDRGAILPGGKKGKAFWYSKSSGHFVSSTYYYSEYPSWVANWNKKDMYLKSFNTSWELSHPSEKYERLEIDNRSFEASIGTFKRTFPHPYNMKKYHSLLVGLTPIVDELTLDFAKTLIVEEKVGQGSSTDFLSISFSATDYIGHLFGPGSLESEDGIYRLDSTLENLISFVDEKVGIENTVFVLSADHGGPKAPEYYKAQGKDAERIPLDIFRNTKSINKKLKAKFGVDNLLVTHSHPYLYLNHTIIRKSGINYDEVVTATISEVMKVKGIYGAYSVKSQQSSNDELSEKIKRNFFKGRSGDIYVVQKPFWFFHSTEEAQKMGLPSIASIHGSPWEYDTHVPVIFAGAAIKGKKVTRKVSPTQIMPTLSDLLGIDSQVETESLKEVVEK